MACSMGPGIFEELNPHAYQKMLIDTRFKLIFVAHEAYALLF